MKVLSQMFSMVENLSGLWGSLFSLFRSPQFNSFLKSKECVFLIERSDFLAFLLFSHVGPCWSYSLSARCVAPMVHRLVPQLAHGTRFPPALSSMARSGLFYAGSSAQGINREIEKFNKKKYDLFFAICVLVSYHK